MPVSALRWGTNFENQVDIGYSLFDILTDREEREGSEHVQSPAGAEDSWIVGRDFTLQANVRWIPDGPNTNPIQTPLSGPVSWQEFLGWARDANALRFVPDTTVPDFYFDNVYLVEPRKGFGSLSTDIKRNVTIKLRNPTVDFHQALRGIMFEYAPGMSLTDPIVATATRASLGTRVAKDTTIATDAVNVLRDRHYVGGVRTTLSERAGTNGWSNPRAFDNAVWAKTLCTITPNASVGPDGASTVDHLVESTDGSPQLHFIAQPLPALADNTMQPVVFVVRAGTRSWCLIEAKAKNGAFYDASFNLATGALGTVSGGGGVIGRIAGPFYSPAGNFYRCTLIFPSNAGGVTPTATLFPATADGGAAATYTGTGGVALALYQGQFETDAVFESSLIDPAAARSGDVLNWPFLYKPQGVFMYYKGIWRSGAVNYTSLMNIGAYNDGTRRFLMSGDTGGLGFNNASSAAGTVASSVAAPVYGDPFEALGYVQPDGKVRIIRSINGGAEVAGNLSGALALPPSFARQIIDVGSEQGVDRQVQEIIRVKVGPLTFGGLTRDTIAKVVAA